MLTGWHSDTWTLGRENGDFRGTEGCRPSEPSAGVRTWIAALGVATCLGRYRRSRIQIGEVWGVWEKGIPVA